MKSPTKLLFLPLFLTLSGCEAATTYLMRNPKTGAETECYWSGAPWEKEQCDKCIDDNAHAGYLLEKMESRDMRVEFDDKGNQTHVYYNFH